MLPREMPKSSARPYSGAVFAVILINLKTAVSRHLAASFSQPKGTSKNLAAQKTLKSSTENQAPPRR